MFIRQCIASVVALLAAACGPSTPKSRSEALTWLQSNWRTAQPHADRLRQLCDEHPEVVTTAGNGVHTLPPELESQFSDELRKAKVGLVKCFRPGVLLHVGGGIEGSIDFTAFYYYSPEGLSEIPRCSSATFSRLSNRECVEELSDGWYSGLSWALLVGQEHNRPLHPTSLPPLRFGKAAAERERWRS
jgi:hypothetical protein